MVSIQQGKKLASTAGVIAGLVGFFVGGVWVSKRLGIPEGESGVNEAKFIQKLAEEEMTETIKGLAEAVRQMDSGQPIVIGGSRSQPDKEPTNNKSIKIESFSGEGVSMPPPCDNIKYDIRRLPKEGDPDYPVVLLGSERFGTFHGSIVVCDPVGRR